MTSDEDNVLAECYILFNPETESSRNVASICEDGCFNRDKVVAYFGCKQKMLIVFYLPYLNKFLYEYIGCPLM